LAAQFAATTLVVTGLFWMVLGGLTGYFYNRFEPS
jgi:predicted cobalt transporter CbtA